MFQKSKGLNFYICFMLIVVAACAPVVAPSAEQSGTAAPVEAVTPAGSATVSEEDELLLRWEGYTEMVDGDATTCKTLTIDAGNIVRHGYCDDVNTLTVADGYLPLHWEQIQSRFAPFTLESDEERVAFDGKGDVAGEAWQRALATYARTSYGEAASGRVGASVRTAMSWWLSEVPEQPGFCRHLVLLTYGYAYISVEPCAGGEATARAEGWLETSEWETVDGWLYGHAPLYQENNYLAGTGTEEMSQAEVAELLQWVEAVYTRIAQATPGYPK